MHYTGAKKRKLKEAVTVRSAERMETQRSLGIYEPENKELDMTVRCILRPNLVP